MQWEYIKGKDRDCYKIQWINIGGWLILYISLYYLHIFLNLISSVQIKYLNNNDNNNWIMIINNSNIIINNNELKLNSKLVYIVENVNDWHKETLNVTMIESMFTLKLYTSYILN